MRIRRVLAISTMAVALLAALALLVGHTPMVRARALRWAIAFLDTRFGLLLSADGVSYNLLTGRATLTNVRLAARGAESDPFFSAARLEANVPLAVYGGRLLLDQVDVDAGRVAIHVAADGTSNLPPSNGATPPPDQVRALALNGLGLRDLVFEYVNVPRDLRITATDVDARLAVAEGIDGIGGPFSIGGGVDLTWQGRALRAEPIETTLAFDGSNVTLQSLPLSTAPVRAAVSGRILRVLDAPAFDLTFDGRASLAEAAAWGSPPTPISGEAAIRGSISGPTSAISSTVRFDAGAMAIGREHNLTASGEVTVDGAGVEGHRVLLSPASGGEAQATFVAPLDSAPIRVEATWQGLDARVPVRAMDRDAPAIGTRLDGRMTFSSGDDRTATFETEVTAIAERGVTPLDGTLNARVDGDAWTATHDLRTAGIGTTGTSGGRIDGSDAARSTIAGPIQVAISSLASAADSLAPLGLTVPAAVREMTGAIDAAVQVSGSVGTPSAVIDVKAPALGVPGIGASSVSAAIQVDQRALTVSPLEVTHASVRATGDVAIDLGSRALSGTVKAEGDDMADLQEALPERWRASGAMSASAALAGTVSEPVIDVEMQSPAFTWAGDTFDGLDGKAQVTGDGVELRDLTVLRDAGEIDVTGRYGFDRTYTVQMGLRDIGWRGVIAGDTETRAIATGDFHGSGTVDSPSGSGHFVFRLSGGLAGDLVDEGAVDVSLLEDHARITSTLPSLGAFAHGTVALAAPYDYRTVAVVNHVAIEKLLPMLQGQLEQVTGEVTLTAAAIGAFGGDRPPRVDAHIQSIAAQVAGVPLSLVRPAQVSWQPGEVDVKEFVALLGTSTITAYGTWADRANSVFSALFRGELSEVMTAARAVGVDTGIVARGPVAFDFYSTGTPEGTLASIDLTGGHVAVTPEVIFSNLNLNAGLSNETVTLNALSSSLSAAKASGSFSASGKGQLPDLDIERFGGTFVIDKAQFDTAGVPVTQSRPSTVSIAQRFVTFDDIEWVADDSAIFVGGLIDLTNASEPGLNLSVTGIAELRALSAFMPSLGFDGTAKLGVHVGGTTATPNLAGSIDLQDAEIAVSSPRVVISQLSGPIAFSGNRVELRGLSGSANGGQLVVDGGVALNGLTPGNGEFYIQTQGAAIEYPRGLRSEIDALLTYDMEGAIRELRGDVRVQRSAYTEPISLTALARNSTSSAPRPTGGASALDDLRLNISVTTVEDISVDNNYGRFEGSAAFRIVGTAAQPGMTGRVSLREGGTIYAAGRTFTLSRGTISFANLNRIEPDIDIAAQTRVSSGGVGDVTLTIQGTPSRLTTDFTSSEGKSRDEINAALLGGGAGAGALALLGSDIIGSTGQQLGLSALRLDRENVVVDDIREDPSILSNDEDPTTRLTMSKRIRDNVEFTVSQNLRENGKTTFLVSFYPIRNLELRAISRDNAEFGAGVRHQVQFGGSVTTVSGSRADRPLITSVTFEGDPAPLTEAQLRKEIKVEQDERFDFYQWQRDLDRMTALFNERGYDEARVRGRRVEGGEGEIDVIFTINRGPLTRLAVEGLVLTRETEQGIREAWTRAVFDRFLIDDAVGRVRRQLLTEGHFEGSATGVVDRTADAKTLRLTVTPGQRAERREIRFTGNTAIARGRLDTVVVQAGLELDGWTDPEALVEALTNFYREEGYFETKVSVEEPRLEGTTGVLTVPIVEGPQAAIGAVSLQGPGAAREQIVRTALGITPPAPYTASVVEEARARVDRRYRQLGYNGVDVRMATAAPEGGGALTLTVTVAEGHQEVLQEVETSGTTRTRPGVIASTLRLRVGQPVNLEEWAQARKRLYDTNVFRIVDIQASPIGDAVDGVQPVKALVIVEEYAPWRFRYGFQVDRERMDLQEEDGPLETNLGAIADLRNQNVFGRAIAAGIAARVERDYYNGTVFVSNASFFGLPLRSNLYLFTTRENLRIDSDVAAATDEIGASFEQRWKRRQFEVTYGYRYERNEVTLPNALPGDPVPQPVNLGRLSSAVIWDRRNNPLDATRGSFSSFSWDQGVSALGSDVRYGKILGQQQYFAGLGPFVSASRVIIGDSFGMDELLPDDRFFAGGATSVRGYAENSLGPRDIFGLARGGSQLVIINQELRFPIYKWLRGVTFADFGNVFSDEVPFAWQQLKSGYGAGLRLDSPIGLLRVDFGIPGSTISTTSRQANTLSSGRWYFGFGNVF